jgi:phosphoglycolate phosphatase
MPPRPIETVLFDLDGTLIDSRADLTSSVNHALRTIGRPTRTEAEVVPHVGNGLGMLLSAIIGPVQESILKQATDAFVAHYDEHCVDETTLYEGVLPTINALRAKTRLGVVTNKPRGFAVKILEKLDVGDIISVVIGGDTLPERKPHPAPLLRAVKDLGGLVASTLVVGDGIQDIKAGQAAGSRTCVARYGYGFSKELLEMKPDYTIQTFDELKEIVLWPS